MGFALIVTRQQLAKVTTDTLQVGESVISKAREVKDLSSWFDRHLDTHMNNICTALLFHLFNIRIIRKFLSIECTKILLNAFVISRLDYCNSLLHGPSKNQLHTELQSVQNAAGRLICDVSRFDHITPSLYSRRWLAIIYSLQFRICFLSGSYKWSCPFVHVRTFAIFNFVIVSIVICCVVLVKLLFNGLTFSLHLGTQCWKFTWS